VKKILLALDTTDKVAEYAVSGGFDVIITHHPMIFSPLRAINCLCPAARRAIYLIKNGVSVMSFHTRLDAAPMGVNDVLSEIFGLSGALPFGPEGEKIGRIGYLPSDIGFQELCRMVKEKLHAPHIDASGEEKKISRVALLGGGGKDFIESAIKSGADAFITGEVSYNAMLDAASRGLCLITAGHYYTEVPVLSSLAALLGKNFTDIYIEEYPYGSDISAV
ncbi:MAG: Nif3-like dinuclear metal center hexameric protein, partial [Eubacteriales bacterium]